VKLLLETGVPVLLSAGFYVYRLKHPKLLTVGRMISKVCVVKLDAILESLREIDKLDEKKTYFPPARRLRIFLVLRSILKKIMLNTGLFQSVSMSLATKIDKRKSSLDYNDREMLIDALVPESTEMRIRIFRAQMNFTARTFLGMRLDYAAVGQLAKDYKDLEGDIIVLTEMAKDPSYRNLLVQRLGLSDWALLTKDDSDGDDDNEVNRDDDDRDYDGDDEEDGDFAS
jgi:hypothetical protein